MESVSVSDYLEGEKLADTRHEYLNGMVVAMAGASRRHNTICGNCFTALHGSLGHGPCRPFMGDLKVRIAKGNETLFYYPDILVECSSIPPEDDYYTTEPKVIIEVLSPSTERIDRREKFWAYQTLDALEEYVLVNQDKPDATVFRRPNQWRPEAVTAEGIIHLPSIGVEVAMRDVYAGLERP